MTNEDVPSLKHIRNLELINKNMTLWICFLLPNVFLKILQTFKWQDYVFWMKKENAAKASAAALKASINAASSEAQKPAPSKWKTFFSRPRTPVEEPVVTNNIYNVGRIRNLWEVIVPLSERSSFSRRKSD